VYLQESIQGGNEVMRARKARKIVFGIRLAIAVGVGAAAGLAGCAPAGEDAGRAAHDEAAAAAERVVEELFTAMNERDADAVLARYVSGDELVHIACTRIRTGRNQLEGLMRGWLEEEAEIGIEHRIVQTRALGAGAAVVAADGARADGTRLYWTFIVRRDADREWRILQEHQSWAGCREQRVHPMTAPE
jgi:ketosteroid isomerase-like protein